MERVNWIDVIKGIAIVMVVIGHCGKNDTIYNWLYYVHLPLFYIVSGLLLSLKSNTDINVNQNSNLLSLISHSAKQLMFPFLGFSLICLTFNYLRHITIGSPFNISGELRLIYHLEVNACWFLPALFLGQICFFAIDRLIKRTFYIIVILGILAASLSYLIPHLKQGTSLYFFILILSRAVVACFWIEVGYLLQKKLDYIIFNMHFIVYIIIICLSVIGTKYNTFVDIHFTRLGNPVIYFIISLLSCISIISLIKKFLNKNTVLEFLGKSSLIIMGTHLTFRLVFLAADITNNIYVINLPTLRSIAYGVVTLILSCLIVYIFNNCFKFIITYNAFKEEIKKITKYL